MRKINNHEIQKGGSESGERGGYESMDETPWLNPEAEQDGPGSVVLRWDAELEVTLSQETMGMGGCAQMSGTGELRQSKYVNMFVWCVRDHTLLEGI